MDQWGQKSVTQQQAVQFWISDVQCDLDRMWLIHIKGKIKVKHKRWENATWLSLACIGAHVGVNTCITRGMKREMGDKVGTYTRYAAAWSSGAKWIPSNGPCKGQIWAAWTRIKLVQPLSLRYSWVLNQYIGKTPSRTPLLARSDHEKSLNKSVTMWIIPKRNSDLTLQCWIIDGRTAHFWKNNVFGEH